MNVTQRAFEEAVERVQAGASDSHHGIHGPRSTTWRIAREAALFLGGGRAALLQLAHPYVAHAVDQHSETRRDPVGRFNRTFLHVYAMIFGDLDGAVAAAHRVRGVHDRIHGPITESVGPFAAGHLYRAHDADALLWVHATLIETAVLVYDTIVAPLSLAEREAYWQESKRFAALFGIPESHLPPDWPAFEAYCQRMHASETLTVGSAAREIAGFLTKPPRPLVAPLIGWNNILTAGFLPPRVREGYGMPFDRAERATFEASLAGLRQIVPRLPGRLRFVPAYIEAERRLAGRPGPDRLGRSVERWLMRGLAPRHDGRGHPDDQARCPVAGVR